MFINLNHLHAAPPHHLHQLCTTTIYILVVDEASAFVIVIVIHD